MNIVFLCNELPPSKTGGIGVFVSELARRLVSRGHNVFVIGFLDSVEVKETNIVDGVCVIKIPAKKGVLGLIFNRYYLYKEVSAICSKENIDIIEFPDFEGMSAFIPKGKHKVIIRLHGSHTYFASEMRNKPSFLIKALEKKALNKADAIVSVSRYAADKTNKIFEIDRDIEVIYNGIDLPKINRCKKSWKNGSKVVFTGSLMKKKGVFSLAKAWPIVKKTIPDAQLIMVGKDTIADGQSAKSKIQKLTEDKCVTFLGHLPKNEMESVISQCDVAIYPSYSETFGLAPIEAMALRVPTIYTKLSCGPEVVKIQNLIDICVNPDDPEDIANKIVKLLRSEDLRFDIAVSGRLLVEKNYSNDSAVLKNEEFYKKVIENA